MAKPKNAPAPAPSPAPKDHNKAPSDEQLRTHRMERLAALTARHRAVDNRLAIKQAEMDEIREDRSEVRNAIHSIGYPLDEFDRSYKDLKLKTNRIDLESREVRREEIREVHGHPRLKQMEFDLERPRPAAADAQVRWNIVGYQDGLQGFACDSTAAGVPPENITDYTQGWGAGQTIVGAGIKQLEIEPPPLTGPEAAGHPDWSTWDIDNKKWTDEQKERFCDWYESVPTDVIPLIDHAGAAAEFKRLDALENAADDFEAPPQEIKKQIGRKDRTEAGEPIQ